MLKKKIWARLWDLINSTVIEYHFLQVSEKSHFSFWLCWCYQHRPRSLFEHLHAYWWYFRCLLCLKVPMKIHRSVFVVCTQLYSDRRSFPASFRKITFFFSTLLMPPKSSCLHVLKKIHPSVLVGSIQLYRRISVFPESFQKNQIFLFDFAKKSKHFWRQILIFFRLKKSCWKVVKNFWIPHGKIY